MTLSAFNYPVSPSHLPSNHFIRKCVDFIHPSLADVARAPAQLTGKKRALDEDDIREFKVEQNKMNQKIQEMDQMITNLRHTITAASDIGNNIMKKAQTPNLLFFQDLLAYSVTNTLNSLDLSSNKLKKHCSTESDTQNKFLAFFSKLQPSSRWVIHDSSVKNFLKDPVGKIDFALLDGRNVVWPQLVSAIELKHDLRDMRHIEAIGQLGARFTTIFNQQPLRQFIVGAVCSDSQIEVLWQDRQFNFKRSGLLALNLAEKSSQGLMMLVKLVLAPKDKIGYIPPNDYRNVVEEIPYFKFSALLRRRPSDRGTFVVAGEMNDESVVCKVSNTNYESDVLQMLTGWDLVPKVVSCGVLSNNQSYMIIQPYGEHLEASKHGLRTILSALQDVATTLKFANDLTILHRDVKPSNIVLYNNRGYLIDWGIASIGYPQAMENALTATLLFCSSNILECLSNGESFSNTIDDDIESLFYTFVAIACDGRLIWSKGTNASSIRVYKYTAVRDDFTDQLRYAPDEFHPPLMRFRDLMGFCNLLLPPVVRPSIDDIITFLSNEITLL